MNKTFGWTMGGLLLLAACNNSGKDQRITSDTVTAAQAEEVDAPDFAGSLPRYFDFIRRQDGSFQPAQFELMEEGQLDSIPSEPINAKRLEPFLPYLFYNTDSTRAIDLYSYNYMTVQRRDSTYVEPGGPDTEIALVDLKEKVRKRILFSGPRLHVLDARWLDDRNILLAAAEEIDAEHIKPRIWEVNLPQRRLRLYQYPDTLAARVTGFRPGL